MRVLFIGDIHFKHNNMNETVILRKKLLEINNYDFAVIAGDVLDAHEKVDTQLMNRAYELIETLRQKSQVYICVGNHDMINNQQFLSENHWMNGLKEWRNVTVVDKPLIAEGFMFVPYVYPGRLREMLDTVHGWEDVACIFAHQEIKGCKMGAIESVAGDLWDEGYPLIISGHIHERQQPQCNVLYPGSVIENGCSLFTFGESQKMTEERIPLGIVAKKTVHVKVGQGIKVKDILEGAKVVISGTIDEITSHKKSKQNNVLVERGVRVVYKLSGKVEQRVRAEPSFLKILESLVMNTKDEHLHKDYLAVCEN